MKWLRGLFASLAVVLVVAVLLCWFLPVQLALPLLHKRLGGMQLRDVHGLLWDGRAGQVIDRGGRNLGRAQWRLSRRALLGQPQLSLQFQGPRLNFSGTAKKIGEQQVELHDARAWLDLALLTASPGTLGTPRGTLELQIPHALLQGPWPQQLQAQAQWHAARMQLIIGDPTKNQLAAGDVALGELQLELHAEQGVFTSVLRDDGNGPLRVAGQLQASPLGWRFDATLHPRGDDPALRRWLQQFGAADAAGDWHVQRRGGLAATSAGASP